MTDVNKTKGMYPAVKGKKRKLAEELANPENELSVTKLCEKFKISRTTFYNWQKEADFNGYIAYLIDSYTDSELANVWKALISKAKVGNTEAIKLYFELKGKYKQTVDIGGGVVFIKEDELLE